jgi:hypothetical protein
MQSLNTEDTEDTEETGNMKHKPSNFSLRPL